MNSRLADLRREMDARKLDALIVGQPDNRRYLSGFSALDDGPASPSALLVITAAEASLLTGFVNYEWAKNESLEFEILMASDSLAIAAARALAVVPAGRVGFDPDYCTVRLHHELRKALGKGRRLVSADGVVERLRSVKDDTELGALRRAARITDEALRLALASLRPETTEKGLAMKVEEEMRRLGASGIAFESIVATGSNSALPHSRVSERAIESAGPLLLDIGAEVDGYCADITRTYWVGGSDERFTEIYGIVREAQGAVLREMRAGMTGQEADAIARQVIAAAGYGDSFGHGLGHGVGLAVHESPRLSKQSRDVLRENMVVTVEPGIYIPGWGGVRIEDTVVVRADGVEVLTKSGKEPFLPMR